MVLVALDGALGVGVVVASEERSGRDAMLRRDLWCGCGVVGSNWELKLTVDTVMLETAAGIAVGSDVDVI